VAAQTHVYEQVNSAADAEVRRIIAANAGRAARAQPAASAPGGVPGATPVPAHSTLAVVGAPAAPAAALK
jgi:membrane fusion protein (multidrug efflux system)